MLDAAPCPPAILPDAPVMTRISALSDARRTAAALWSWGGTVPSRNKAVEGAILYRGDFRLASPETVESVVAFIAAFIPGGRTAPRDSFTGPEYRHHLDPCIAALDAELTRLRRQHREGRK